MKSVTVAIGEVVACGPVRVAKIQVGVQGDEVVVNPDTLAVPSNGGCLIVWELDDSVGDWTFLGPGISFKDDVDGQFVSPVRDKLGRKCMVFDRNNHRGRREFNYTVALVDPKNERAIIKDPIIENEGDG